MPKKKSRLSDFRSYIRDFEARFPNAELLTDEEIEQFSNELTPEELLSLLSHFLPVSRVDEELTMPDTLPPEEGMLIDNVSSLGYEVEGMMIDNVSSLGCEIGGMMIHNVSAPSAPNTKKGDKESIPTPPSPGINLEPD